MMLYKVSRLVPVAVGTQGNNGSTVRHMLVSIPRVRFLERPGEPTDYYCRYAPPCAVEVNLTDVEREALALANIGLTYSEGAKRRGVSLSAFRDAVLRARAKTGVNP